MKQILWVYHNKSQESENHSGSLGITVKNTQI
jgi:hypothetical protein